MHELSRLTVTSPQVQTFLEEVFGHANFRNHQEQIVSAMLEGRDLLAVMGTGGGKSLCFQLPALLDQERVTLVVSPTISLMRDQIEQLNKDSIKAVTLNSSMSKEEKEAAWDAVHRGAARIIYLSPEHLSSASFYESLEDMPVGRIVVDEAHCVSCWGHDFRGDYQKIPLARKRLGNPPVAAFTATAPVRVRDDILKMLDIPEAEQFIGDVDRPELSFEIQRFDWGANKSDSLIEFLQKSVAKGESVIVYANTIRTLDWLLSRADELQLPAGIYHGQLAPHVKNYNQAKFLDGSNKILFATKAFGMGINKPDVRAVIHFEPSESVEGYFQEAGRAGRDGQPSRCILMYTYEDLHIQRVRLNRSEIDQRVIQNVYSWIWGRAPKDRELKPGVVVSLVPTQFASSIAKDDESFEGKILASIAYLNEFGYISVHSGKCTMLREPDAFAGDEDTYLRIKERFQAKLRQAKIMELYLNAPDPRAMILGYFRHDDPDVECLEFNSSVTLNDEQVRAIARIAAETNPSVTQLNFAVGRGQSSTIRSDLLSAFPRMSPVEQELALTAAENLGVVSRFRRGRQSLLYPTSAGLKLIREGGYRTPVTFDEMRLRMLNPDSREILREAIYPALVEILNQYQTTIPWSFVISKVTDSPVTILDKALTVAEVAGIFEGLSRKEMKDGKVVSSAVRNLSNFLFDNIVDRPSTEVRSWIARGLGKTMPTLDTL